MSRVKPIIKERETDIVRSILDFLCFHDIFAWRNNTGAYAGAYLSKGGAIHRRFIRFGHKGSADILGCLPDGKFLAIEVKTHIGKLSPDQKEFLARIEENNGMSFVATCIEDTSDYLESYLKHK